MPAITYLDFFEYDNSKETPLSYVNSNFQLNIADKFLDGFDAKLNDVNFTFNYQLKGMIASLNMRNGKINNEKEGIVLQTKITGKKELYNSHKLKIWLDNAHDLSSNIFKSLTKGQLYASFKK